MWKECPDHVKSLCLLYTFHGRVSSEHFFTREYEKSLIYNRSRKEKDRVRQLTAVNFTLVLTVDEKHSLRVSFKNFGPVTSPQMVVIVTFRPPGLSRSTSQNCKTRGPLHPFLLTLNYSGSGFKDLVEIYFTYYCDRWSIISLVK